MRAQASRLFLRLSGEIVERSIELRLRRRRLFLGAPLPRLFVLALFQPAHVLGPLLAFPIAHEPLSTQPCFRSWKCRRRTSVRIRGRTGLSFSCDSARHETALPSASVCATMPAPRRSASSSLRYSSAGASLASVREALMGQPPAVCPPRRPADGHLLFSNHEGSPTTGWHWPPIATIIGLLGAGYWGPHG